MRDDSGRYKEVPAGITSERDLGQHFYRNMEPIMNNIFMYKVAYTVKLRESGGTLADQTKIVSIVDPPVYYEDLLAKIEANLLSDPTNADAERIIITRVLRIW